MNSTQLLVDPGVKAALALGQMTNDWLPGFIDPSYDAVAVRECWQDAVARPGYVHGLPAGVMSGLLLPGLLPAGSAALMLSLTRAEQPFWLGLGECNERMVRWLTQHTQARCVSRAADAVRVVIRAADAQADLLAQLPSRPGLHAGGAGAILFIEVPELRCAPPPPRREPGDLELTPRIQLSGQGMAAPQVLAVGGINRRFWRTREVRQANADFGVDIVLVQGWQFTVVPAGTHVRLAS